jgi:Rrf2 family protein
MKISTKGRYSLRMMLDLAVHGDNGPVPLRDVARRQEISDKYLEQLAMALCHGGLISSVRGANGGYLLTREKSAYTVGEILRLMEGDLGMVPCVNDESTCSRVETCVTHEVWQQVSSAVADVVDNITLEDLTRRYWEKNGLAAQAAMARGGEKTTNVVGSADVESRLATALG